MDGIGNAWLFGTRMVVGQAIKKHLVAQACLQGDIKIAAMCLGSAIQAVQADDVQAYIEAMNAANDALVGANDSVREWVQAKAMVEAHGDGLWAFERSGNTTTDGD